MLSQATDRNAFQVLRLSFSFDGFISLISVLVDTAPAFLYHHDIQLRNTLSTSLLGSYLLFLL